MESLLTDRTQRTAPVMDSDNFDDAFSSYTALENHIIAKQAKTIATQAEAPIDKRESITAAEIRQWITGRSPFLKKQVHADLSKLVSRSRSISLGSEKMRDQMPESEVFENVKSRGKIVGVTDAEVKRWMAGKKAQSFVELNSNNKLFYIGRSKRDEAERMLESAGQGMFLLYGENQSKIDESHRIFLYYSKKNLFHHLRVRTSRQLEFDEDRQLWDGTQQFYIFSDRRFVDLNDLVGFYSKYILSARVAACRSDPLEALHPEFKAVEDCRMLKTITGRCCGGKYHKH